MNTAGTEREEKKVSGKKRLIWDQRFYSVEGIKGGCELKPNKIMQLIPGVFGLSSCSKGALVLIGKKSKTTRTTLS